MTNNIKTNEESTFRDNTLVSMGIYNREFIQSTGSSCIVDSDCGCLGASEDHKCIYLNLCIDTELYNWVSEQGMNYHETISKLIKQAIQQEVK